MTGPAVPQGLAAVIVEIIDQEVRWAQLAAGAGGIAWNGRCDWRSHIGERHSRLMAEAEAAGIWSPPDETTIDASGDDPLRAGSARAIRS